MIGLTQARISHRGLKVGIAWGVRISRGGKMFFEIFFFSCKAAPLLRLPAWLFFSVLYRKILRDCAFGTHTVKTKFSSRVKKGRKYFYSLWAGSNRNPALGWLFPIPEITLKTHNNWSDPHLRHTFPRWSHGSCWAAGVHCCYFLCINSCFMKLVPSVHIFVVGNRHSSNDYTFQSDVQHKKFKDEYQQCMSDYHIFLTIYIVHSSHVALFLGVIL